jgi:DNA-binding transcriptional LysR family regulator
VQEIRALQPIHCSAFCASFFRWVEQSLGARYLRAMPDRADDWRTFAAVARSRSFVKAARELARSPQAVTRAVAALEARLGVRLLHRTTRAVSLTSDGARLLEKSRRVLEDLAELERPIDVHAPLTGSVTITAPVLFGQMHVGPLVTELIARHKQVNARLVLSDRVVSLADEGVDVAVRIGALPDSALRARLVGHVRSVLVATPHYLEREGRPRTPDDLQKHACIAFTGTTPIADRWQFPSSNGRERSVAVRARLTVNTGQAALDAALADIGIVRVLSYQVAKHVERNRLRVILEEHEPPPLPVHVVHAAGALPRAAEAFVALAHERLTRVLGA